MVASRNADGAADEEAEEEAEEQYRESDARVSDTRESTYKSGRGDADRPQPSERGWGRQQTGWSQQRQRSGAGSRRSTWNC